MHCFLRTHQLYCLCPPPPPPPASQLPRSCTALVPQWSIRPALGPQCTSCLRTSSVSMPGRHQLTSNLEPWQGDPDLPSLRGPLSLNPLNPLLPPPPGVSRPSSLLPHACLPYCPNSKFFVLFRRGAPNLPRRAPCWPPGYTHLFIAKAFGEEGTLETEAQRGRRKLRRDACLSNPLPPTPSQTPCTQTWLRHPPGTRENQTPT